MLKNSLLYRFQRGNACLDFVDRLDARQEGGIQGF